LRSASAPGDVVAPLAQLFHTAGATEASWPCVLRLRSAGVAAARCDDIAALPPWLRAHLRLAERGGVDVVSLLNVLDRCDAPRALLRDAAALLRPGGRLLLALRLPLDCFVLGRSDRPRRPREGLLQPAVAPASWAEAAGALVAGVTAREGLTLEAFAQVPYLCQGDSSDARFYALDDFVGVFSVASRGGGGVSPGGTVSASTSKQSMT